MYTCQSMSPLPRHGSLFLLGTVLAFGCDIGTATHPDASLPSQRVAEVSVRIDGPSGGTPALQVLAFRASVTGARTSDVLGAIDPLWAPAPDRCEVRDVAAQRVQGGTIDLEELPNVSLALSAEDAPLHPAPRNYPQLAASVGGVVGEAGPVELETLPEAIDVSLSGEVSRVPLALQEMPKLLDQNGETLVAKTRLDPTRDLQLTVAGPARSFLEIRPFGASRYIACPAGAGGRVVVPSDLLQKLTATSGNVAVSFEAVWRDSRMVSSAQLTRLSIEARSSAVLDLRADVVEPAKPTAPPAP
jgi:hypothetical protein